MSDRIKKISDQPVARACEVIERFFTGMTVGTNTAPEKCRTCSGSGLVRP